MQIKIWQVYTFNDSETYDVIVSIEPHKIWYQIWQIKDLTYWDEKTKSRVVWSKAMPNNEGTVVDLECMTPIEFEEMFNIKGKLLGKMNKEFGLNKHWRLVPIDKADKNKKWEPRI